MSIGISAALVGGVAAAGGAIGGALISSGAASAAGAAQTAAAQTALQQQLAARAQSIAQAQSAAQMTAGEINSINTVLTNRDQQLSQSLASINKQQTALDQIAPNVQASGKNLYDLLTGKSAAILAPLQTSINNQRQQMMDQLSSQMGPGFMTSSAGIMAMTNFDQQASMTLNTAQMNAIQTVGQQYGNLTGLQQQGQAGITSATGSAFNNANTATLGVLQAQQFNQNQMVNATLGGTTANPLSPFSVVPTAGAANAGAGIFGQTVTNLGGAGVNIAALSGFMGAGNNNGNSSSPSTNPFGDYGASAVGGVGMGTGGSTYGNNPFGYSPGLGASTSSLNLGRGLEATS